MNYIFYISLCLNQLYCGRQQTNVGFFSHLLLSTVFCLFACMQTQILSVISLGGDNSKASSLWKHIQLCWINKNMEEENQQQMQVGKPLLTIELKLLSKLLFWQCSHFLLFGRSLPFLTMFHCLFYFYFSKPFSHLTGLFLLFILPLWKVNPFKRPASGYPAVAFSSISSTEQWEQRLTCLLNLLRFSFQCANIK